MNIKKIITVLLCISVSLSVLAGCGGAEPPEGPGSGLEPAGSMELEYAENFSLDYYEGGYKLITVSDGCRYIVVPEGAGLPKNIAGDIIPIFQPLENIYLAASSAMCLFDAMDRLDAVRLSGTRESGWYVEGAAEAMNRGDILFAGKYSEPDYELIVNENCDLALESLMIGHAPEVKEKLMQLGIPVFVDNSSSESHPLGRTEWIKLYGALLNEEDRAEQLFSEQTECLRKIDNMERSGATVAFFRINSSGLAVVRKSGDYVSRMIDLAGGDYVFRDIGDPAKKTSTVSLEMESFYSAARDADFIIYNSTIGSEIRSLEELLELSDLLKNFKAVKNGNVWCTEKNMFQESMQLGKMIENLHTIFENANPELTELDYFYRLQ
ncbi:MAG: ABC transporter substrate-binding protein [Candidatus Limivicinus sp.]|jgi:iron complex transport system substrate-binding protein